MAMSAHDSIDWVVVPQVESYLSQYLLSVMLPLGVGVRAGSHNSQSEGHQHENIFIVLCPDRLAVQQRLATLSRYTERGDNAEHFQSIQVFSLDGRQPPHQERALLQRLQENQSRQTRQSGRTLVLTTFQKFKSIQFVDFLAHVLARGAVAKLVIEDAHLLVPQSPLTVYDLVVSDQESNIQKSLQKSLMEVLGSLKTLPPILLLTPPLPAEVAESLRATFHLPVSRPSEFRLSLWTCPQVLGFTSEQAKKAQLNQLLSDGNQSCFVLLASSRKRASMLADWLEEQDCFKGQDRTKASVIRLNTGENESTELLSESQLDACLNQGGPCVVVSGPQLPQSHSFYSEMFSKSIAGFQSRNLIFWDTPQSLWQIGVWAYQPERSAWDNLFIFHSREDFQRVQNMWLFRLSKQKDRLSEVQNRLQAVRHWILDSQCHTKALALYFCGQYGFESESKSRVIEDFVGGCSECSGCLRRNHSGKLEAGKLEANRIAQRSSNRQNTFWMEGWRYVLRHFIY